MRTTILIFIMIGLISCNQSEKQKQSKYFPSGSKWTFIKKNKKSKAIYAEIEFKVNHTLTILSEIDGQVGPFQYRETDNTLTFNNFSFTIIPDTNCSILLKNTKQEFILYKIPFAKSSMDTNQIDPFYLRRCYYLVQLGFISTDKAIEYLSNTFAIPTDSMPKKEMIFSNSK